ncbi:hypothetical protein [Acinetobacter pittii]
MVGSTKYKDFIILNKEMNKDNLDSMIKVLSRAKDTMINPRMLHFVSEIIDIDAFPNKFIQSFKEKFISEIKLRNKEHKKEWMPTDKVKYYQRRRLPEVELLYSIESKIIKIGEYERYLHEEGNSERIYHHIHIMIIVDIGHNDYGRNEIKICVNKAISRISGLEEVVYEDCVCTKNYRVVSLGFLKLRDSNSKVKVETEFIDYYWHDLKKEFEDAIIRASYLCKTEQKLLLPERFQKGNSFNITREKRS